MTSDPRPAFLRPAEASAEPADGPPVGDELADGGDELSPEENTALDRQTVDRDALERLARLSPVEYDRVRQEEAECLGVRVGTLDAEVKRRRAHGDGEGGDGAVLPTPEPWAEPVAGDRLLNELAEVVERHLVVPTGAAEAVALWTLHAHAHDTAAISPILAVTSPTPECGKTTLLTILGALVPRPLPASNITAAALFRAVEKWRPTLVIDEADSFLKSSDELRGIINSGHNRAAAYVIRTQGDDYEPRRFATWSPKAIASIGKLPATLASRAIHIELRRMAPAEKVEPVRADRLHHLEPLAQKAARWAADNEVTVRTAEPDMPAALVGRRADNWRHLLAIADTAGCEWPERARRAAEALAGTDSGETAGIMLLADIRVLFAERSADRLTSAEIAEALAHLEGRPWPEWRAGKPITPAGLARILEPFKVRPKVIRTATGTPRGYLLADLEDAFCRYLGDETATPQHTSNSKDLGAERSATAGADVADGDGSEAAENRQCCTVAVSEPEGWEGELGQEDMRADYEERAAVLEYEAGLSREEAEAQARAELEMDR